MILLLLTKGYNARKVGFVHYVIFYDGNSPNVNSIDPVPKFLGQSKVANKKFKIRWLQGNDKGVHRSHRIINYYVQIPK